MYSRLSLSTLFVWAACNLDVRQTVGGDHTDSEEFRDASEHDLLRRKNTQGLIEIPTQALRGTLNMQVRARKSTYTHCGRMGQS